MNNSIPVIDIERLHDPRTLARLDAACREWGFFQVVNHGIDTATIERLQTEARAFFSQPSAVKRTISRTPDNSWGFYDQEPSCGSCGSGEPS